MANKWITSLKEWNKDKPNWCVPKKGSKDYDEIKKMMNKKEEPKKEKSKIKLNENDRITPEQIKKMGYAYNIFNEKAPKFDLKYSTYTIGSKEHKDYLKNRSIIAKKNEEFIRQQRNEHKRLYRGMFKSSTSHGIIDKAADLKATKEAEEKQEAYMKTIRKKKSVGAIL